MSQSPDALWFCGPNDEAVHRCAAIARAAYFRAERRGFQAGHELEDWIAAEQKIYGRIAGHAEDSNSTARRAVT
jgi:hypothetical protein